MSFIYDDANLIKNLIRYGLDFENKFTKTGQTVPTPTATDVALNTAALKMLDDLENESSAAQNPGSANITSDVDGANLTLSDLNNLGSLIQFLIKNKIMIDYQRIAYDATEKQGQPYVLINVETTPYFASIGYNSAGFYVNKDLIVKYLTSLQETAHSNKITAMENRLKYLIDQANKQLKVNMSTNYAPNGSQTGTAGNGSASDSDLHSIIAWLPLDREDISFPRIKTFFDKLEARLAAAANSKGANDPNNQIKSRIPEITSHIAAAKSKMETASAMTKNSDTTIEFDTNYLTIVHKLNDPMSFVPFLQQLQNIVESAAAVVANMYAIFFQERDEKAKAEYSDDERALVRAQFQGSNHIAADNVRKLQALETHGSEIANFRK